MKSRHKIQTKEGMQFHRAHKHVFYFKAGGQQTPESNILRLHVFWLKYMTTQQQSTADKYETSEKKMTGRHYASGCHYYHTFMYLIS